MPKYNNPYLSECVPKYLQVVLPNCLESKSNASFLMLYLCFNIKYQSNSERFVAEINKSVEVLFT